MPKNSRDNLFPKSLSLYNSKKSTSASLEVDKFMSLLCQETEFDQIVSILTTDSPVYNCLLGKIQSNPFYLFVDHVLKSWAFSLKY